MSILNNDLMDKLKTLARSRKFRLHLKCWIKAHYSTSQRNLAIKTVGLRQYTLFTWSRYVISYLFYLEGENNISTPIGEIAITGDLVKEYQKFMADPSRLRINTPRYMKRFNRDFGKLRNDILMLGIDNLTLPLNHLKRLNQLLGKIVKSPVISHVKRAVPN